jgi:uracil-DNA glycosylase
MKINIEKSWKEVLGEYLESDSFRITADFVRGEYLDTNKIIYPEAKNVFNAFNKAPFDSVKVVILGQDPYHNPGQSHGLCFSVQKGIALPPSLKNIYKEIESDLGVAPSVAEPKDNGSGVFSGNLESWAEQGVLLLNAVLTVEKNKPGSHTRKGPEKAKAFGVNWEEFTDEAIKQLSDKKEGLVFLLWGNYAKQKGQIINKEKHLVLEAAHPSPFSAYNGFFGCKHFSKVNTYLKKQGKRKIEW